MISAILKAVWESNWDWSTSKSAVVTEEKYNG